MFPWGHKKYVNVKVLNLMSMVNETGYLAQHESCEGKLNRNIYNSKQKWNHHKCPFKFKG